jgi:hypothetical protein
MAVPDFGELFIVSKGAPIKYGDKTLMMADKLPARLGDRFVVTIESTDSQHPQGVGISEGVEVFGSNVKRAVVWEYFSVPPDQRCLQRSRLPFFFEVCCRNKKGYLAFYNMTEFQGRQEWWNRGSAMWATDIANGRRYFCNDFDPDDDFNDLVFTVVRMATQAN